MRTTPPPGGSTTSSLPGRCCRNEHAFHTVSSSAGYCHTRTHVGILKGQRPSCTAARKPLRS